ncbi:MAG: acylphosphatase [Candidatus Omnitrophota bacterium]
MKQQAHVYYSGRVQGVGFRYKAVDLAERLGITGWVKNLGDGRVEIIAEAEEAALREFLDKLKEFFSNYIREADIEWQAAAGAFENFQINF